MPRPRTTANMLTGPLTLAQAMVVAQWYETFAPKLRGMLVNHGVPAQDVDDVLQDVAVRVIEYTPKLATFDHEHRRNYVYSIAETVLCDRARRFRVRAHIQTALGLGGFHNADALHNVTPLTASDDWVAQTQPEQTTAARLTLQRIWELVPEQYREVLNLLAQGFNQEQIAAHLGTTPQAIANRMGRMRHVLLKLGEQVA